MPLWAPGWAHAGSFRRKPPPDSLQGRRKEQQPDSAAAEKKLRSRCTTCAWTSRGRCMGARPIPILHMRNCAAVIYLGVPRSGVAGRSTRRGFRGRSRAGRIAGALGCSGIFAVLCRDNAGRDCGIGTKGRRFFLAACPSVLLGYCQNLLGGMAGRSRLSGCAGGRRWTLRYRCAALFACLSRSSTGRRWRKHPSPSKGRSCRCWALLRRSFGWSSCPRLTLCRSWTCRCRSRRGSQIGGFWRCSSWRCPARTASS